jgi:hypothetical protein
LPNFNHIAVNGTPFLHTLSEQSKDNQIPFFSPFHVPETHGKRQEALYQSNEEVRMEDQLCVDKAVRLAVTGRTKHNIRLRLLVGKSNGSGAVGQTADNDHQE